MRKSRNSILLLLVLMLASLAMQGQDSVEPKSETATPTKSYEVEAGTKIPLAVLKSISTKNAVVGDAIYLETIFPVIASGKIVIPRGSYVSGSVTEVKKPGRARGRAQLRVRLESLILPSGETLAFPGSIGGVDPSAGNEVDEEGAIVGKSGKGSDAKNILTGAGYGAMAGAAIGAVSSTSVSGTQTTTGDTAQALASRNARLVTRSPIRGALIGTGVGAAAVYTATLFMRGPDAILTKGTDIDMVLDRSISFEDPSAPAAQSSSVSQPQNVGLRER